MIALTGFPEPQTFINGAKNTAFTQLSPYFAAIVGFTLVVLILRSFLK